MSEGQAQQQSVHTPSTGPNFPQSILSVSRKEHYQDPLGLNILSRNNDGLQADAVDCSSSDFLNPKYWQLHSPQDSDELGPLPPTLKGHVFIIGTAASFDSTKIEGTDHIYLPTQDGWQHIYSGDGMIYRLDFHASTLHPVKTDNPYPDQPYTTLAKQGWAHLATRLIKTPDYYADLALEENERYSNWPNYSQSTFKDAALTRLSMSLGGRNYLNTAWLPLKPKHNNSERLLVTWDAGRPYEIDPCSLGLVAPVGLNKDWKPIFDMNRLSRRFKNLPGLSKLFPILSQVFPMILSSAHPVYDEHEDAIYLVNASKSLQSVTQIPRLVPYFKQGFLEFLNLRQDPEQDAPPRTSWLDQVLLVLLEIILWVTHSFISFLSVLGIGGRDHLFLYRWQGQKTSIDESEKWEVVTERGWPIPIHQSVHQMALTKDYLIISDSSFKFVMADVLPSLLNPQDLAKNLRIIVNSAIGVENVASKLSKSLPIPTASKKKSIAKFEGSFREQFQFLFSFLNYPQTPYTDVYVIPRSELNPVANSIDMSTKASNQPHRIKAKHFRLEPETAHFLTSYDNPDHKVILHVGHISGLDPAEFVNKIDRAICHYSPDSNTAQPCSKTINKKLQARSGVLANSMAPNQVGTWTLDLQTGRYKKTILNDEDKFQLLAFFAFNEKTANQVTDVYWNCGGAWPHHHTLNHLDLYKEQIESDILDRQINQIAREGRPSNLLRVNQTINHVDQEAPSSNSQLKIADAYDFPPGFYASSPQFVPKGEGDNEATNGYIICVVLATNNHRTDREADCKLSELWIFDAAHLRQGPLYRLNHPELNMGPTLHTAWLSKLESPPPRPDYDVREDYKTVLDQVEPEEFRKHVLDLFERDVFPYVIDDRTEAIAKQTFKIRIFDTSLATAALQNIHRMVDCYASAYGYSDPEILNEDQNLLFRDIQYQTQHKIQTLTPAQHDQVINTGVDLYLWGKFNRQVQPEAPELEWVQKLAGPTAALLKTLSCVDNAVLLLGELILIKATEAKNPPKTYVKRIPLDLQNTIDHTPEFLDSSQAMVNLLFNRGELPDAIADQVSPSA